MVWAAVSKTWKCRRIFVKVNTNVYIDDIFGPALRDMKETLKMKISTSNSKVLSYTSNKTHAWCKDTLLRFQTNEMWSPSFPALNTLDFSVQSMLKTEACRSSHITVESLKVSLVKAWAKIPQKKLRAAVVSFRGRIERLIVAEGWHIENQIVLLFCEAFK